MPIKTHFLFLCSLCCLLVGSALAASPQPNIVFILADDLGWNQIGKRADVSNLHNDHASEYYLTPQINRLAEMGMTFNRAYAAPNCAPTRASLMSGLSPARHGVSAVFNRGPSDIGIAHGRVALADNKTELDTSFQTVAETLKAAGYRTGHFGKWHLGTYTGPNAVQLQGFDVNIAGAGNEQSSPMKSTQPAGPNMGAYHADRDGLWRNMGSRESRRDFVILPKVTDPNELDEKLLGEPGEHLTDKLTAEAIAWMGEQAGKNPAAPFFVYLAQHATHSPLDPKASDTEALPVRSPDPRHQRRQFGGLLYGLDRSVGAVLDFLENTADASGQPLIDNTIVIFMGDNGGADLRSEGRMAPLRGSKGTQFEGGVRVPLFISTPAMRAAGLADTATDQAVHVQDFHATLAALAGAEAPDGLDGIDVSTILTAPEATFEREIFDWWTQNRSHDGGEAHAAFHRGEFKLIWYPFSAYHEDPTVRFDLFNVVDDLSETTDLSGDPAYRERFHSMAQAMEERLRRDQPPLPFDLKTGQPVPLPYQSLSTD
jgi:arylsulfatase A-like enzyme